MASLSQANLYASQGRTALEQRRREFSEAEKQVSSLNPKIQQTRAQLLSQTLSQKQQVRVLEQSRQREKAKLISELKQQKDKFESDVGSKVDADIRNVEAQISDVRGSQNENSEWRQAESLVRKEMSPASAKASVGKKMRKIYQDAEDYKNYLSNQNNIPQIATTSAMLDKWRAKADAGEEYFKNLLSDKQIVTISKSEPQKRDVFQKISDFHEKRKGAFEKRDKPEYNMPFLDFQGGQQKKTRFA